MTVLAMTAGLFLIFCFHICILADRLTESYFRFYQLYLNLIFGEDLADDNIQMLVAHTIEQCLTVLGIVDSLHGQIFLHDLGQSLCYLIIIALVLCIVAFVGIGNRKIRSAVLDRVVLRGKGITGLRIQFSDSTDIACMKLRNLDGAASFHTHTAC